MIVLYCILGAYSLILFWLCFGFLKTKTFYTHSQHSSRKISIIITARDEEKYLARCINSIAAQDYPRDLMDIVFIDDASSDHTLSIAKSLLMQSGIHHQIIKNTSRHGKKLSIRKAVQLAKADFIITRDADTFTISNFWLENLMDFWSQTQSDFMIGPIALSNYNGLLWALQAIENNILAVIAAGSSYYKIPFLCSGANLAFTKKVFNQTNGYQSHLHIESGDDILFLEEVKKIPGVKINYLKTEQALVYTYPCFNFKSLIEQKVRWAGKFKMNSNIFNSFLAVVTFLVNILWLFCFIYWFISPSNNVAPFIFVLLKLGIDFLILLGSFKLIKNKSLLWYSLPVSLIYPIYTCIVAIASLFLKPKWKS